MFGVGLLRLGGQDAEPNGHSEPLAAVIEATQTIDGIGIPQETELTGSTRLQNRIKDTKKILNKEKLGFSDGVTLLWRLEFLAFRVCLIMFPSILWK